jgi:uncharacterized membrane protein (DUF373 family)
MIRRNSSGDPMDLVLPGFAKSPDAKDVVEPIADWDAMKFCVRGIKLLLSLLIATLLTALAGGVFKIFLELRSLFYVPVEEALRHVIVGALLLLAVVEVLKTTLTYLTEGRVKVTFIVDTILVVMLTEVIAQWFKDSELVRLAALGGTLLVLTCMRILAVRCSPAKTGVP